MSITGAIFEELDVYAEMPSYAHLVNVIMNNKSTTFVVNGAGVVASLAMLAFGGTRRLFVDADCLIEVSPDCTIRYALNLFPAY